MASLLLSTLLTTSQAFDAFRGFVYNVDGCTDLNQVNKAFTNMKKSYNASLVITFGGCDRNGYYASLISAAGSAGIQIIPLVWFGYEGGTQWKTRADVITKAVIANPKPVYAIAYGDEPLYDWAAGDPQTLANAIITMKNALKAAGLSIPVSISEMAWGFQQAGNPASVFNAIDMAMINTFPYFAQNAEDGGSPSSWTNFMNDVSYFQQHMNGKPILVTQTGWPSDKSVWPPNSPKAVVNVQSEHNYFSLLDNHCTWFRDNKISWMARTYDEQGLPGWGWLDWNENPKFQLKPKTC